MALCGSFLHCHHSFAVLDEVVSAAVRDCWSLLEILLLRLLLLPLLRLGLLLLVGVGCPNSNNSKFK